MKVIILAGGRGTRLAQSARDIPKALVPIAGKPLIQHQIEHLGKHGLSNIRLALCFRAHMVIDYIGGKYEYCVEQEPLGTGGAIAFASRDLNEPFMVLNGDILSDFDFSAFIAQSDTTKNYLVTSFHPQNTDFGLVDVGHDGKVTQFLEKPKTPTDGYVNVGFYFLQPSLLKEMREKQFSIEYDVFPTLAKKGQLWSFEHTGFWIDAGTEERLAKIRKINEKSNIKNQNEI